METNIVIKVDCLLKLRRNPRVWTRNKVVECTSTVGLCFRLGIVSIDGERGAERDTLAETGDDTLRRTVGSESLPRTPNDVPTRGSCKQIKTSRIVRTTREKIRVIYNSVSRRATSSIVHILLVHDIGAIIRSHCPMNT
ncbi:Uncharacterized protein Fot_14935 [Forsythia ovata]|uniref:Uncharacterized protein n=1 Tax=Forsythia ovata TaxID=205694 RepID=A0ABD1W814_9LAMI